MLLVGVRPCPATIDRPRNGQLDGQTVQTEAWATQLSCPMQRAALPGPATVADGSGGALHPGRIARRSRAPCRQRPRPA
eukprot:354461-Chlamydomonas_euryale.AAC.7